MMIEDIKSKESTKKTVSKPKSNESKLLLWLIILLVAVIIGGGIYYYFFMAGKTGGEEVKATPTADASWLTYTLTASVEESSEANSAVEFSIKYPNTWYYKVLDDEVKAQGAGSTLHMVAFDTEPQDKINLVAKRLSITAESTDFDQAVAVITGSYTESGMLNKIVKTQGLAGGGKMIKIVDNNKQNANDNDRPLYVFVQSPYSWILTFEGSTTNEATVDKMLSSLKF